MGDSLKKHPEETLRKKLEAIGLPRAQHDFVSLRKLLHGYFKSTLDETLDDVNIAAELIIYLHKKKLLSFKDAKS